jgi:demethoxyubiquinone hydroxylase (CLK1/Coq7/Cat5 family)
MNIFEFAMQMERDGEAFYRDLAVKSANAGVTRILNMLADDEVKHYNILKQMSEQGNPEMAQTTILLDAKNVFAQMQDTEFDLEGIQVDLYRKAQDIERQAQEFYEGKADQATKPAQRALLLRIADEEKRHYLLLDSIIEFLDRPRTWLEDAEFTHLDEY